MSGMLRRAMVACVAAGAGIAAAGCNGGGSDHIDDRWVVREPMPKDMGRLVLDARRDGDKFAYGYGYVLIPLDLSPSDPDYKVLMEPNAGTWDRRSGEDRPRGIPPVFYLRPGRYGVDIFGVGACFRGRDIVVRAGEETVYRASMDPGGSIEGVVLGPATGTPVPGIIVWRPLDRGYGQDAKDWDPKTSYEASRICRTTEEGYYYIPDLPPGENVIIYYAPDVGWMEKKVNVVDGRKLQLNPVRLEPR